MSKALPCPPRLIKAEVLVAVVLIAEGAAIIATGIEIEREAHHVAEAAVEVPIIGADITMTTTNKAGGREGWQGLRRKR